ncbi:unnamed protein product, partial [Timema podura]|nr:unnamed protein product [Timema podura]
MLLRPITKNSARNCSRGNVTSLVSKNSVTILYCSFVYKLLGWMKYLLWFLPHICLSRGLNMFSAQVVKNIRCRQLKDDKTFVCTLDPSHLCC